MTNSRQKAIQYIKECRKIHMQWIISQECGELSKEEIRIGGGKSWHKKWVRQYNAVLKELQK